MKSHWCSVLPRVRSNSLSSPTRLYSNAALLDSSSPPRPVLSSPRLAIEAKPAEVEGHTHNSQNHSQSSHPPFSLAFTQPQSSSGPTLANAIPQGQYALFPYSSLNPPPCPSSSSAAQQPAPDPHPHPRPKRQRLRYQLDVGAYGIPKRSRAAPGSSSDARRHLHTHSHQHPQEDLALSVQVGEDAYFVRGNAMGVADGVGGWSKPHHPRPSSTPSALFARRLMHHCSAEVDAAIASAPGSHPPLPSKPQFSFTHHLKPRPTPSPWTWSHSSLTLHDFFAEREQHQSEPNPPHEDFEQDLEDSLEELSEGIDVLQILERAYDKTLKTYVVPPPEPPPPTSTPTDTVPLLAGSSTALLAVLDHPHRLSTDTESPSLANPPATITTTTATATATSSTTTTTSSPLGCELQECDTESAGDGDYDAVIKIAHVGDCMGMLVRGEDIAWRSEEMWWDFNTPVQLGPSTSTSVTPRNSARVFTVPVKADDILILASDGLSDNLWDEDVLDEVVRFKKAFLPSSKDKNDSEGKDSGYSSPSAESISLEERHHCEGVLKRRTLAGMLSEALCSRARSVSECHRHRRRYLTRITTGESESEEGEDDEVPFARRAREAGKRFSGGKNDDISVVVAVISPKEKHGQCIN